MGQEGRRLVYCKQCGGSFTQTKWPLHAHNPSQIRCDTPQCGKSAVGYWASGRGLQSLCGNHLLEVRRSGQEVTIVDGSVCRLCYGLGEVQSQGVDPETPGGRWARCPHCQGSAYDADLKVRKPDPPQVVRRNPFSNRGAPSPPPTADPGPKRELSDEAREWLQTTLSQAAAASEAAAVRRTAADRPSVAAKRPTVAVQSQGINPETSRGRWVRCPHCLGSGYDLDDGAVCRLCYGLGGATVSEAAAKSPVEDPGDFLGSQPSTVQKAKRQVHQQWPGQQAVARSMVALAPSRRSARAHGRYRHRRRASSRMLRNLSLASLVILAGAVVGVLFIFPVLPDAVADQVADLQQRVSDQFSPGSVP